MRPPARRALQTLVLLLLGVVVLAVTVSFFGTDEVLRQLAAADRRLLGWAALVFFTQFFTMGLRWWLTLRLLGHRVPFVSILRANAGSNFLNFFAPGHFGEPAMAAWLGRTGRADGVEAFSALVGAKVLATIMSFMVLIACVPLLYARTDSSWLLQVGGTATALGIGTLIALVILLRPAVASWGARLAGRIVRRAFGALRPDLGDTAAERVEGVLLRIRDRLATFATHPGALLGAASISALKVGSQILFVVLLFRAFGHELTVAGATFLVTVDVLQNAVSIWIPANLGVQEALITAAATGGLDVLGPLAASAALAQKGILLVHIGLGGLAFVVLRWIEPTPPPPPGESSSTPPLHPR